MGWDTHGMEYTQGQIHTGWDGVEYTRDEIYGVRYMECNTRGVGYTEGVRYIWGEIYTGWDTHGVRYTRNWIHTRSGIQMR